ncbi:hypothetical protein Bbelb_344700 [Branchiostoma belcheri]|nr:hypothetical protein Bbelb_344700 [Branchiostoma belcheri]
MSALCEKAAVKETLWLNGFTSFIGYPSAHVASMSRNHEHSAEHPLSAASPPQKSKRLYGAKKCGPYPVPNAAHRAVLMAALTHGSFGKETGTGRDIAESKWLPPNNYLPTDIPSADAVI